MTAEDEEIGAKINNRKEWAPVVKDATILRGP
jgi:hypothetical protein